jgi:ATP synthase protein I
MRQFAVAMELPFVLVSAVVIAGLAGYLLDRWLGSAPWLMILFGGIGFYAGVRDVLRRLEKKDGTGSGPAP